MNFDLMKFGLQTLSPFNLVKNDTSENTFDLVKFDLVIIPHPVPDTFFYTV